MFRVFGLTGGIGSGKSTVARHFRARGLPVVDADAIAREVVAPGSAGLADVVREFGTEVLIGDALNRGALAARVFAEPDARKKLEAITHPRIRALTDRRFAEYREQGHPLVCNEVPLLVEVGLAERLRPLVVVTVRESTQLTRAAARDGSTLAQIEARMKAQLPLAEKVKLADYVIDNEGSQEETLSQADKVLDAICLAFGVSEMRYPRGESSSRG